MVIPSILANTNQRELVEAAKKQYSTLNRAIMLAKADNGGTLDAIFPADKDSNYSMDLLAPYLNIAKRCSTSQTCWTEKTKYLNRRNNGYGEFTSGEWNLSSESNKASAILTDGARIVIQNNAAKRTVSVQCGYVRDANDNYVPDADGNLTPKYCTFSNHAFIYIDVNGAKGPNRFGMDTWEFRVYENKIDGCGWADYNGCIETVLKTDKLVQPVRF